MALPYAGKPRLSRVYLDDVPVTLMGDEATPELSRIIRAGGKRPDRVDVLYLTSPADRQGRPVHSDEVIDRAAEPTRPIYLRTVPREGRPIRTVSDDDPWPPDAPAERASRDPMPNLDPVIAQLGEEPRHPHVEGVFRSPSQAAPGARPAPVVPAVLRRRKRAETLADAEAEAEQRQEDERNREDALQDEQEAERDADEDAGTQQ
jgi:hypothetical protein